MKRSIRTLFAHALAGTTLAAQAHEGHGLPGIHWHATDVLGFVGVAALVVLAIWASRK